MRRFRYVALVLTIAVAMALVPSLQAGPAAPPPSLRPTLAQYLKPGMPVELVSARKVDRIAWIAYEEG